MLAYLISALCIFLLEAIWVYQQYKQQLIYSVKIKLLLALGHSLLFCLLYFLTDVKNFPVFSVYVCYILFYIVITEHINEECCAEYYFDTYAKNTNIKHLNKYIGLSILLTLFALLIWIL